MATAPPDTAALLHVAKALATEVRLDRLLRIVMDQAAQVLDAERCTLFLYDADGDELWSMVAQGLEEREIRLHAGQGLAGEVARTQQPLRLADAYAHPRFNPAFDAQTGFRTRSVLAWPIVGRDGTLLGVLQALNKRGADGFSEEDGAITDAFSAHVAVAIERAWLVEVHVAQQRMQESLDMSRGIQRDMLPPPFEVPPASFALQAVLEPAEQVGGDFYDFFFADEHRLGFAVGDVSGKGAPAAILMAATQTLLRSFGEQGLLPAACLEGVNRTLRSSQTMFATLFYATLDVRTGLIEYANAGHPPPCIVRSNGDVEGLPKSKNLPLSRIKGLPFRNEHVLLAPDDMLVLYTDGLLEATAPSGDLFGTDRLLAMLRHHAAADPEALVERMQATLHAFAGGAPPRDDMTLLALRYLG